MGTTITTQPEQQPATSELIPISIIRTETVLSKLPIHNLAKTGNVEISVSRRNAHGVTDLQWEVSYNAKYGQPRQLAYKLDTLVINRRIDEQRRPLPKLLKLGSLNQICGDLDLNGSGKNVNNLKRAILQNAGAMITAKLSYRATDGGQKRLEAAFTRYSVIFTGERLPNGKQADGVYLSFHEPYWEVLNSAPVRPLDYEYLKELPPAPQRFYEVVSYRIFAALKNNYPVAKLPYSEYCTCSAQSRYYEATPVKKQMYKVHRPHMQSGYITDVRYEETVDSEGRPDWNMYYVPGPKAQAEYTVFQSRAGMGQENTELVAAGEPGREEGEPNVIEELVRRGIGRQQAVKLVRAVGASPRILDQLEWGDYVIAQASREKFHNPPGFYVHLIRENIAPPLHFETHRIKMEREEAHRERNRAAQKRLEQESAYREYLAREVEVYIASPEHTTEYENVIELKQKQLTKDYRSLALCGKETLREVAAAAALAEISGRLAVMSFEEFCAGSAHQAVLPFRQ